MYSAESSSCTKSVRNFICLFVCLFACRHQFKERHEKGEEVNSFITAASVVVVAAAIVVCFCYYSYNLCLVFVLSVLL